MSEKLIELFKNEEFCVNFFEAIDKTDELKSLLGKNGINISDEELKADYILPKAFDPRVCKTVAKAVAECARNEK